MNIKKIKETINQLGYEYIMSNLESKMYNIFYFVDLYVK